MKFKSILLATAVAAIPAIAQVVTGSNVCGVMRVDSTLKNTIVSIPWVEVGTADEAVKVANLVMTANLTPGDQLFVYDAKTWYQFMLNDGKWTASTTVAGSGKPAANADANKQITQGSAIFLVRANATEPFYLYGQKPASPATSITVTAGTGSAAAYTLVASPKAAAFDLNAAGAITGGNDGDKIVIPQDDGASIVCFKESGMWMVEKETTTTLFGKTTKKMSKVNAEVIPVGTGFWYVSKGASAATVNF